MQPARLLNNIAGFCPPLHPWLPILLVKEAVHVDVGAAYRHECSADSHVKVEQNESLHIAQAYAVVHPGAVVVHGQHARLAQRAVVGARRLHTVALITHLLHAEDLISAQFIFLLRDFISCLFVFRIDSQRFAFRFGSHFYINVINGVDFLFLHFDSLLAGRQLIVLLFNRVQLVFQR